MGKTLSISLLYINIIELKFILYCTFRETLLFFIQLFHYLYDCDNLIYLLYNVVIIGNSFIFLYPVISAKLNFFFCCKIKINLADTDSCLYVKHFISIYTHTVDSHKSLFFGPRVCVD